MIKHQDFPIGFAGSRLLKQTVNSGKITIAGNATLKIYGTLQCKSGKRMKVKNRVFFQDEAEALAQGFRPCGHCMRAEYLEWKTKKQTSLVKRKK